MLIYSDWLFWKTSGILYLPPVCTYCHTVISQYLLSHSNLTVLISVTVFKCVTVMLLVQWKRFVTSLTVSVYVRKCLTEIVVMFVHEAIMLILTVCNACVRSQEARVMTAKISQDSVNVSLTMQDRTVIDVLLDSTAIQTVSVSMQGTQFQNPV